MNVLPNSQVRKFHTEIETAGLCGKSRGSGHSGSQACKTVAGWSHEATGCFPQGHAISSWPGCPALPPAPYAHTESSRHLVCPVLPRTVESRAKARISTSPSKARQVTTQQVFLTHTHTHTQMGKNIFHLTHWCVLLPVIIITWPHVNNTIP